MSVAAMVMASACPAPAQSFGGNGSVGNSSLRGGVGGGFGVAGTTGGSNARSYGGGGGGGGAGAAGGNSGATADPETLGGAGGASGTLATPATNDGSTGNAGQSLNPDGQRSATSGGGGGGGGNAILVTSGESVEVGIAATGGNGGNGGDGGSSGFGNGGTPFGAGGGGGSGGFGLAVVGPTSVVTNASGIAGGKGVNSGGCGNVGFAGASDGGSGGGGVYLGTAGTNLTVQSGSITGGRGGVGGITVGNGEIGTGGAGGAGIEAAASARIVVEAEATVRGGNGAAANGTAGAGGAGAGVVGSGLTIVHSGSIIGGMAGDGTTIGNAVRFVGGDNRLELRDGASLVGNVVGGGFDTLSLGGAADSGFDVSTIGDTAQIRGFEAFEKTGTSTWTLSGSTTAATPWRLVEGTLAVEADGALGATSSGLTFAGGMLRSTGTFASARAIALEGDGRIETAADTTTTLGGIVSGTGRLIASGTGNLVLSGENTHTGGTEVAGGALTLATGGSLASDVSNGSVFVNNGTIAGFVDNIGTATNIGSMTGGISNSAIFIQSGTVAGGIENSGSFTQTAGSIEGGLTNTGDFNAEAGAIDGAIANSGAFTISGAVTGDDAFSNTGEGTLVVSDGGFTGLASLSNDSTAESGIDVAAGARLATVGAFAGTTTSSVTNVDGTLTFANAPYAGMFTGSGRIVQTGGSFTASASNTETQSFRGTYDLGGLMVVSGVFGDLDATGGVNEATVNVLAGGRLSGMGRIAGSVFTQGGTVDGDLSVVGNTTIGAGGTLTGTPTIGGNLFIGSGGTLSPGNSPGTVTVLGNVAFDPSSRYDVEVEAGGASDRLVVGGSADLGGSSVVVTTLDPEISYADGQRYLILDAADGLDGTTFSGATLASQSAFLTTALAYEGGTVSLLLGTIAQPPVVTDPSITPPVVTPPAPRPLFVTAAATGNQFATAQALDSLAQTGESLSLYNAILFSNLPNARVAFEQLAGEIHASTRGALLDGSRHVRDSISSRIDGALGNVAQGADVVGAEGRFATSGLWVDGFGSFGEADGNANAASADRDVGGVFLGYDRAVTDNALLGVFGGYSRTDIDVDARRSSAEIDTGHVGVYGAGGYGVLELSAGAAYAWNRVDTERSAAFPGFSDRLTASYDADTAQVFGEIGTRFVLGGLDLTPFAGLAYVHQDADGFTEQGGAARLTTGSQSSDATFATLGLRASHETVVAGREIAVRGMAGWRHASGDTTPTSTSAFVTGLPFTVSGAPISKNAAIVEAGFSTEIVPDVSFTADYVGQFGEASTDNGFRIGLSSRF